MTRPGDIWLKSTLVEAAQAAARTKGTYLRAKYYRLASRRGRNRAVIAIAHKILVAAYHILRDKREYRELGEGYLDQRQKNSLKRYWVRRLEKLGYHVTLEETQMQEAA